MARQSFTIDVGDVGTQNKRRFLFSWYRLQDFCLPNGQLNSIRSGGDQGFNCLTDILDPAEEGQLVKEAVVNCHVKAFAVASKKAIQAGFRSHKHSFVHTALYSAWA